MSEKQKWIRTFFSKGNRLLDQMSPYAQDLGEQVRDVFGSAPSEILERAGEKGRAMRMHMRQRDLEHQLGRAYLKVGKLACEELQGSKANVLKKTKLNEAIKSEVVVVTDILSQLEHLREEAEKASQERAKGIAKKISPTTKGKDKTKKKE